MPFNPFIGLTQSTLEIELRKRQQEKLDGKRITYAMAGEVQVGNKTEDLDKVIREILYALYLLAPETYPLNSITRVTRTRLRVYTPENDRSLES